MANVTKEIEAALKHPKKGESMGMMSVTAAAELPHKAGGHGHGGHKKKKHHRRQ